nr:hypothetical protein [Tanacetum cinerariifolium]
MLTRSRSRHKITEPLRIEFHSQEDQFKEDPPVATMTDNRTMTEMLRAPTEGYAGAIVVPLILAEQFELKHSLINMMTSEQVFGLGKDNPHDHLRWKSTSLVESDIQTNATIADNRTMTQMLQAPIEGYEDAIVVRPINANNFELKQTLINLARIWLDKEPLRSILTWEDLVSKFINQFFPPSKTTYLRNEITNFLQKSNETFNEACECFKDLLRQCPHHGFSELHQLDTFYNALNPNDQDALDSAAGGNFLDKIPRECLSIIESKSKVRYSRSRVTDFQTAAVGNFIQNRQNVSNQTRPPGFHQSTQQNNNQNRFQSSNLNQNRQPNQGAIFQNRQPQNPNFQALPQQNAVTQGKFEAYTTANDANMNNLQLKFYNFQRNQQDFHKKFEQKQDDFQNQMMQFMQNIYNKPSTSSSSSLPRNTIPNPKGEAKAITTRSDMSYKEPPIPPTDVNQQEPIEVTKDTEPKNSDDIHPPTVQAEVQVDKSADKPIVVIPKAKPNLPYPSRLQKEKNREKDDILAAKFMEIFRDLHFELSFADALIHMPKFAPMFKKLLNNKDKLIELTKMPLNENCSAVVLKKLLEKLGDPDSLFNMDKDILFLESLLRDDPIPPHPIIPNQVKLPIEEINHSLKMGYEHFNTNLLTKDVTESSTKNLIPIPNGCIIVSDNGSQSTEPINDDSSNLLCDESTMKSDYFDEFYGPFIPIHILEEERIKRDHADYIKRMEMLFTINPRPYNPTNDNKNVESFSSFQIPNQERKPRQEEIDVVSDDVLPPSNDDSDDEVDVDDTPSISYNNLESLNKVDLIDATCEEYSQAVLGFTDDVSNEVSSPFYEPIVSNSLQNLTPFDASDFLLLKEADAFITIDDEPISSIIDATYYDPEGDILILEA